MAQLDNIQKCMKLKSVFLFHVTAQLDENILLEALTTANESL